MQVRRVTSVALPEPVYQPAIVSGATNRLWPYSRLAAAVRTMNGATGGNLSNVVVFDTPEGGKLCDLYSISSGSVAQLVEFRTSVS